MKSIEKALWSVVFLGIGAGLGYAQGISYPDVGQAVAKSLWGILPFALMTLYFVPAQNTPAITAFGIGILSGAAYATRRHLSYDTPQTLSMLAILATVVIICAVCKVPLARMMQKYGH